MAKKKASKVMTADKNKSEKISNIKKVSMLLVGVSLAIFLLSFISTFSQKSPYLSEIPSPTQSIKKSEILSDVLIYKAPDGWDTLIRSPDSSYETIYSPGYAESIGGKNIEKGSRINLEVLGQSVDKRTLEEIMVDYIPNTNRPRPTIISLTINEKIWVNAHICWEGCRDDFLTTHNDSIVRVSYECTVGKCNNKNESDSSKYVYARDSLLNSIIFK